MTEFSLQALHDEIEPDPEGIGYKDAGVWKGDQVIAGLINDPANGANILRRLIQPNEVVESIDHAEWTALAVDATVAEARRQYISLLVSGSVINANKPPVFDGLNLIFNTSDAPNTRTSILAKIQRQGSRAEVLWGERVIVTTAQVGHAFNL